MATILGITATSIPSWAHDPNIPALPGFSDAKAGVLSAGEWSYAAGGTFRNVSCGDVYPVALRVMNASLEQPRIKTFECVKSIRDYSIGSTLDLAIEVFSEWPGPLSQRRTLAMGFATPFVSYSPKSQKSGQGAPELLNSCL